MRRASPSGKGPEPTNDGSRFVGRTLVDVNGNEVGTVTAAHPGPTSGSPLWLRVEVLVIPMPGTEPPSEARTGGPGGNAKTVLVPLEVVRESADRLTAPYNGMYLRGGPPAPADGLLTPPEERKLSARFGLPYTAPGRGEGCGLCRKRRREQQV